MCSSNVKKKPEVDFLSKVIFSIGYFFLGNFFPGTRWNGRSNNNESPLEHTVQYKSLENHPFMNRWFSNSSALIVCSVPVVMIKFGQLKPLLPVHRPEINSQEFSC